MTGPCESKTNAAALSRHRRSLLRTAIWGSSPLLLWTAAGLFLSALPAMDAPKPADVLVVLAPPGDRIKYAEQLMDRGYAGSLAISVPLGNDDPVSALCGARRTYRIVCFSPNPVTTQGEARSLRSLTAEYGWKSANVLTNRSHVPRARVILERCFSGELSMIAFKQDLPLVSFTEPKNSWIYHYAYESAAFVKVTLNQDC